MIDVKGLRTRKGSDDWLELAINSNKDTVDQLKELKPIIKFYYNKYERLLRNQASEPQTSAVLAHSAMLKSYYTSPPKDLGIQIKARRENDELSQCPFCGRPGYPRILDHFLPKNRWPEYSLLKNNLVNQCSACSSKKSESYFCIKNSSPKFIHPIYSSVLSKLELEFSINIPNPLDIKQFEISLEIKIPPHYSVKTQKRVKLHIQSLEIRKYAIEHAERTYLEWIKKSLLRRVDILDMLKNNIILNEKLHNNDWTICLQKAMSQHPILIRHFEQHLP